MSQIRSAVFIKSSSSLKECPSPDRPEYAFIGRSNVGKSSLINLLTNNKKLAKVSSRPGKTQLINHFNIDDTWYLVDLPGYGWANVSKMEKAKWKKMTEEYFGKRENLACVFILIDSRHLPQDIDLEFIRSMGQKGMAIALVFTKVDKLGINKSQANISAFRKVLKKDWEELPPIFISSAVKGLGAEELIKYIRDINAGIET